MDDVEKGERVKLILKNNFVFTGIITDADDKAIILLDKFGKKITLARDSLMVIEELL